MLLLLICRQSLLFVLQEDGESGAERERTLSEQVETDWVDTWRVLEELRSEGLVRHIGLSNFARAQLDVIVAHARDPPECLQVSPNYYTCTIYTQYVIHEPRRPLGAEFDYSTSIQQCTVHQGAHQELAKEPLVRHFLKANFNNLIQETINQKSFFQN